VLRLPIWAATEAWFLRTGDGVSDNLTIVDSLPTPQAEITLAGDGTFDGYAGGQVILSAPVGEFVIVQTSTGTASTVAPVVSLAPVDQGGGVNVSAAGIGLVEIELGAVGGFTDSNFDIINNWNAITDPIDRFPIPGNVESNTSTQFDTGTHRFSHFYEDGNPGDAADPIPFDTDVGFDAKDGVAGSVINGIEFFEAGVNVSRTELDVQLVVPGEGLFGSIVFTSAGIETTEVREVEAVDYVEFDTQVSSEFVEDYTLFGGVDIEFTSDESILYFRIEYVDKTEGDATELPIEWLENNQVLDFFRGLPNNRYNVYFQEAGAEQGQILFRLNVFENKFVPTDFPFGSNDQQPLKEAPMDFVPKVIEDGEVEPNRELDPSDQTQNENGNEAQRDEQPESQGDLNGDSSGKSNESGIDEGDVQQSSIPTVPGNPFDRWQSATDFDSEEIRVAGVVSGDALIGEDFNASLERGASDERSPAEISSNHGRANTLISTGALLGLAAYRARHDWKKDVHGALESTERSLRPAARLVRKLKRSITTDKPQS